MRTKHTISQGSRKSRSTTIGATITALRVAKGWSQAELARRCGWRKLSGQGRISHYEKSRRLPDALELQKFADVFAVPVGTFFGGLLGPLDLTAPVFSAGEIMSKERMAKNAARLPLPKGLKAGKNTFIYMMDRETVFVDPDKKAIVGNTVLASRDGKTLALTKLVARISPDNIYGVVVAKVILYS